MKVTLLAIALAVLCLIDPDTAEILRRLPDSNDDFSL